MALTSQKSNSLKRNGTIDVVRIIASFMVVFCHVVLPGKAGVYSKAIARFAVPWFMMITGYYLYNDDEALVLRNVRKSFFSVIKLVVLATVLISIINSCICVVRGQDMFSWFLDYWSKDNFIEFILFNRAVFLNSAMWYLFALIYVLFLYLLILRIRFKYYNVLIIPLLVLNLLLVNLLAYPWYYVGNWLLTGVPFVLLGGLVHARIGQIKAKVKHRSFWHLAVLVGLALTIVEASFKPDCYVYVGTIVLAMGMLILSVTSRKEWNSRVEFFGRWFTPIIFIIHCSMRDLYSAFFHYPKGVALYFMPAFIYIVSAVFAGILIGIKSLMIYYITEKKKAT